MSKLSPRAFLNIHNEIKELTKEQQYKPAQKKILRILNQYELSSQQTETLQYSLARVYAGLGQHKSAIELYNDIITNNSEHELSYISKARSLEALARQQEIEHNVLEQWHSSCLAKFPNNPELIQTIDYWNKNKPNIEPNGPTEKEREWTLVSRRTNGNKY